MDKDRAIITQVCAKIAADLTTQTADVDAKLGEFATLFSSITDIMMESIYGSTTTAKAIEQNNNVVAMVKESFKAEEIVTPSTTTTSSGGVQVVGKQHGDLPDWLIKACKRDGVSKVYDNRDGLSSNAKRPHFKAVDAEKAYWPPRGK
jgi:hypothetical protein